MQKLLFDRLYRSGPQAHVRYVGGERKEEPYYLYYYFRGDGVWLSKTTDAAYMEPEDFLADIDLAVVLNDPHHDEPLNELRELLYQCGDFEVREGTVYLKWKHSQLEEKERSWYFRIRNEELLETDFAEYQLRLLGD